MAKTMANVYTDVASPTKAGCYITAMSDGVRSVLTCLNHAKLPTDQKEVLQSWWNVAFQGSTLPSDHQLWPLKILIDS